VARTYRLRHHKELHAKRIPIVPDTLISPATGRLLSFKERNEFFERCERRCNKEPREARPQNFNEAWFAILTKCRDLTETNGGRNG
jgi:hypothetical protein